MGGGRTAAWRFVAAAAIAVVAAAAALAGRGVLRLLQQVAALQEQLDTALGAEAKRQRCAAKVDELQAHLAPYQEAEGFAAPAQDEARRLIGCPVCGGQSMHFPGDFCRRHRDPLLDAQPSAVPGAGGGGDSGSAQPLQPQLQSGLLPGSNDDDGGADTAAGARPLGEPPVDCRDPSQVVITKEELQLPALPLPVRRRALRALRDCGFLFLDEMFPPAVVDPFKAAYETFKAEENAQERRWRQQQQPKHGPPQKGVGGDGGASVGDESAAAAAAAEAGGVTPGVGPWRYPVQGFGRREYFLPFRHPFNSTAIHGDGRLRSVLAGAFHSHYKLELQTVISSPPGTSNQRWHQGWRFLFDPQERLDPYAIIVGVALSNVTMEMGPTEFCPGYNKEFYNGLRCPAEEVVAAGMTKGSAYIFDYKTLHRGPGNRDPEGRDRDVLMLAYSLNWFFNGGALVNRGRPLAQTVHQRRYWEQWHAHPSDPKQFFEAVAANDEGWGGERGVGGDRTDDPYLSAPRISPPVVSRPP